MIVINLDSFIVLFIFDYNMTMIHVYCYHFDDGIITN